MKTMEVVKYILQRAQKKEAEEAIVSNLKLQKMLYFVNLEYVKIYSRPLIDEDFEAWPHGAVIRSIYNKFSFFASNHIFLLDYELENKANMDILNELNDTIDDLLKIKPWDLVALSHKKGGAWSKCYQKGKNNKIPFKDILDEARKSTL